MHTIIDFIFNRYPLFFDCFSFNLGSKTYAMRSYRDYKYFQFFLKTFKIFDLQTHFGESRTDEQGNELNNCIRVLISICYGFEQ